MLTSATSLWMDASTETAGVDFRDGSDPGPDHVRTLSTLSTVSASHQELPGHGPLAYLDDSSASYLLKRLFTTAELEEDEPIRPTDVHSRLQTLLLSQPKQLLREQSSIHPDDLRASAPSLDDELKQMRQPLGGRAGHVELRELLRTIDTKISNMDGSLWVIEEQIREEKACATERFRSLRSWLEDIYQEAAQQRELLTGLRSMLSSVFKQVISAHDSIPPQNMNGETTAEVLLSC